MDMEKEIIKKAKAFESYVVDKRRDFHMYPELKFEEERTSSVVVDELSKMGYKIEKTAGTGVIGILEGDGKTVALRADMDALPIQEENDVPYKSKIPGKMHACGHDAHTAMLLGAAKILAEIHESLNGTVKLIFQPGEEGGLGAKKIVEEGHLDDVDSVFGIHVWADLPAGTIGLREGPLLASADAFRAVIKGKGGHGAAPHQGIDPIAVAMDIANAYQKIISREIDPLDSAVMSITKIQSGTTFNVIPERAELWGTIRAFKEEVRDYIVERMAQITEGYAKSMRCEGEFELTLEHIPPTVNDGKLTEFSKKTLNSVGPVVKADPTLGSEDFSFYSRKVPGVFLFLGIRNEEKGIVYPHHHPKFDLDESVLWMGSAIYSLLAYSYLRRDI